MSVGNNARLGVVVAACALGGCTYHLHVHNHLPPAPPPAAYGQAFGGPPLGVRPLLAPTPAPEAAPYAPRILEPQRSLGLLDGTFASGGLEPGWRSAGVDGGLAAVVRQGEGWAGDPGGVSFPSPPHAALVRSSVAAPVTSVGVLVSAPFVVAAKSLRWKQLSEAADVAIVVQIEDAASGVVLVKSDVAPSVGAWQAQELDVGVACQRPVRIRVSQHTKQPGFGYFTVFDDIGAAGEGCTSESPYQPTHL